MTESKRNNKLKERVMVTTRPQRPPEAAAAVAALLTQIPTEDNRFEQVRGRHCYHLLVLVLL